MRASIAAALVALACSGGGETQSAAQRGATLYRNVCATCHGADPGEAGVAGPAIAGSSRELVEAKVLRAEYPPGYTPKRESEVMPKLPHLADHIDDLAAYLESRAG